MDHGLNPVDLEHCGKAPSFYTGWFFVEEAGCRHALAVAARKPGTFSLDVQGFKFPQGLQEYGQCVRESPVADE